MLHSIRLLLLRTTCHWQILCVCCTLQFMCRPKHETSTFQNSKTPFFIMKRWKILESFSWSQSDEKPRLGKTRGVWWWGLFIIAFSSSVHPLSCIFPVNMKIKLLKRFEHVVRCYTDVSRKQQSHVCSLFFFLLTAGELRMQIIKYCFKCYTPFPVRICLLVENRRDFSSTRPAVRTFTANRVKMKTCFFYFYEESRLLKVSGKQPAFFLT